MIFTSKCGHGKSCPPFSRRPGKKRAGNLFQDFLLGGAAGGGWYSVLKVRVRLARFQFNIRSVEKFVLSKHKRI